VDWEEYRLALTTIYDQAPDLRPSPFHSHEEKDELGYKSFGLVYNNQSFDHKALDDFFQRLNSSGPIMGKIVRAKGVFQVGDKWVLMELASGEFSYQPLRQATSSKVSIIGCDLNQEMIREGLNRCVNTTKNQDF